MRSDQADLRALHLLSPIVMGYLPWSGSAIAPQTAVQVCNELALNERRTVVELGAGVSTIVLAMWAESEQQPIHVTSIDEDEAWIRLVRRAVERFNFATVEFVHAPLKPYASWSGMPRVTRWFDLDVVDTVQGPIDMLLVDGPTAHRPEWRCDRWPALPQFADRLSGSCAVLLDDTLRPGESLVLRSWLELFPRLASRPSGPATWLVRGPSWTV